MNIIDKVTKSQNQTHLTQKSMKKVLLLPQTSLWMKLSRNGKLFYKHIFLLFTVSSSARDALWSSFQASVKQPLALDVQQNQPLKMVKVERKRLFAGKEVV